MIEVSNLVKQYGTLRAVDNLSFTIEKGEIVGLLGPNGAGKSTTMKILTTYLAPNSGSASIDGVNTLDNPMEIRKRIGYLPENAPLYPELPVLDYLQFVAEIRNLPSRDRLSAIKRVVKICGLETEMGKLIGQLSKGNRQRVGLAQTLIHDPEILILDEPTSGLDPNQIVEIREVIKEIGKTKTVILSTHILPEVQATCDRIIIIAKGKLMADGKTEELTRSTQGASKLHATFKEGQGIEKTLRAFPNVSHVERIPSAPGEISLSLSSESGADLRQPVYEKSVEAGWTLLELRQEYKSLEHIFGQLTGTQP